MASSARPKRHVIAKATSIIETSDTDEENEPPSKRIIIERDTRSRNQTSETRRRWPTKTKNLGKKETPITKSNNTYLEEPPLMSNDHVEEAGNTCHKGSSSRPSGGLRSAWELHELLAETEQIEPRTAKNIVDLFSQENTIPFICRYRRDLINHITPERLRDIKVSYNEIVALRKKSEHVVAQLEKEKLINDNIRNEILCAKSIEELEFLYAPYKPTSKGSLAERAKALGLDVYAVRLLFGEYPIVNLESIVQINNEELNSTDKILNGICHIISNTISKHTAVLEEIRRLQKVHRIMLQSSKSTSNKSKMPTMQQHKAVQNISKYEIYFKFEMDVRHIKPHQILAINRGEKSKFLMVKVCIPNYFQNDLKRFVYEQFLSEGLRYPLRSMVLERSFEECYKKKCK